MVGGHSRAGVICWLATLPRCIRKERGFFLYTMKILFENQLLFSLDLIFKGFFFVYSEKVFFAWFDLADGWRICG